MSDSLVYQSLSQWRSALDAGELSSRELTQAFIDRTQAVEDRVKAFNSQDADYALAQADASDARRAKGESAGTLDGIPVGLKDLIAVKDQPLTCSSKMLAHFTAPYDATVTERLKAGGAVLWGRLNMDEFAMGSSTENSAFKKTSNPWDLERIPGGSSGGSAAAVAAGEVGVSLGSDTGGSIRQPASHCGVVGLKPTYGRVSRYGLVAFASSLDQIGPLGHRVEDVARTLNVIGGNDPKDSTSSKEQMEDFTARFDRPVKEWTLGVPTQFFGEGLDPKVKAQVQKAIDWYADQGCRIEEVSLPHADLSIAVYYIIATAEASSNLSRFDGVRYSHRAEKFEDAVDLYFQSRAEGFGDEVKRRIILGTYVLSSGYYDAYYLRAQKVRSLIRQDYMKAFEKVDALLAPTSPVAAFKMGEKSSDPLQMYLSDIYTLSANLAGIPGMSLPCGFTDEGLPVGLQVLGKPFGETDMLAVAHAFEDGHDYWKSNPSL